MHKNAFSPKSINHIPTKSGIPSNYNSEKKDPIGKVINSDQSAEKIVLKSSSKLTFSPNATAKKFKYKLLKIQNC
jgi:hypothetical protein